MAFSVSFKALLSKSESIDSGTSDISDDPNTKNEGGETEDQVLCYGVKEFNVTSSVTSKDEHFQRTDIRKPTEEAVERGSLCDQYTVKSETSSLTASSSSDSRIDLLDVFSDKEIIFAAVLAHFSYRTDELEPSRVFVEVKRNGDGVSTTGIDLREIPESDRNSGFCYRLFYNSTIDRYYLCFRGTHNRFGLLESVKQGIGVTSSAYDKAMSLAYTLVQRTGKDKVVCIGHSLGGGLAIAASKVAGCKSIVFNPANVSDKTVNGFIKKMSIVSEYDIDNLALIFTVQGEILTFVNSVTPSSSVEGGQKYNICTDSTEKKSLGFEKHKIKFVRSVLTEYLEALRKEKRKK